MIDSDDDECKTTCPYAICFPDEGLAEICNEEGVSCYSGYDNDLDKLKINPEYEHGLKLFHHHAETRFGHVYGSFDLSNDTKTKCWNDLYESEPEPKTQFFDDVLWKQCKWKNCDCCCMKRTNKLLIANPDGSHPPEVTCFICKKGHVLIFIWYGPSPMQFYSSEPLKDLNHDYMF